MLSLLRTSLFFVPAAMTLWIFADAQQLPMPPPPPNYQELLERALTRESSAINVCTQRQEDLVKYFQAELRKLTEERDALRKQMPQPAGAPANGK